MTESWCTVWLPPPGAKDCTGALNSFHRAGRIEKALHKISRGQMSFPLTGVSIHQVTMLHSLGCRKSFITARNVCVCASLGHGDHDSLCEARLARTSCSSAGQWLCSKTVSLKDAKSLSYENTLLPAICWAVLLCKLANWQTALLARRSPWIESRRDTRIFTYTRILIAETASASLLTSNHSELDRLLPL